MSDLVDRAVVFATRAHHGQLRKGDAGIPYITHPLDVMARLERHGIADEVTLAAAVLHDVVEDCGVTVATLIELFGVDVGATVAEVSDTPGLSKTKAKKRQLARASQMSLPAKLIKIADKTSNVHDIVVNPPGWSPQSILGYTRSSMEIVDAIGPVHDGLVADFRAAANAALDAARQLLGADPCECVVNGEFELSPGATRFRVGAIVDVAGIGGPYEVVAEPTFHEGSGRWLHPCRIPLWHPQATLILDAIREAAKLVKSLDPDGVRHYPGSHLRLHVHERP